MDKEYQRLLNQIKTVAQQISDGATECAEVPPSVATAREECRRLSSVLSTCHGLVNGLKRLAEK